MNNKSQYATDSRRRHLDRRKWLQVSSIGWLATSPWLRGMSGGFSADESITPRIRSCILVFLYGGPSQLETFDPKPLAPAATRGEYQAISTAVPGIMVGEHLPLVAKCMRQMTLIRSMRHSLRNHNPAAGEALTGRAPGGGDQEVFVEDTNPSLGSMVGFGLGPRANVLPYVALPYTIQNVVQIPGQTGGWLGAKHDRFQVTGNPNQPGFRVAALQPPANRQVSELRSRSRLLRQIDTLAISEQSSALYKLQQRAEELVTSDVSNSFDMSHEGAGVRDRYGRTLLGQSLLLSRRLVESGVNFVTVFDGRTNGQNANWDSHEDIFPRHRQLIPPMDQGLSALIDDLHERGLLESTLVVVMGEFGRTPKINAKAGRDHWPDCYTVVLAGGGTKGGAVYGASDKIGAYPDRDPVTPADLIATILWRFGINPAKEFNDRTNRPLRLSDGKAITALFS